MLGSRKVLAVIAARGGSKGLPRKNVLPCGHKPLIGWTIAAAAASTMLDRAIVSSDDPEILEVARACGADVPFVRPAELASDGATMDAVALHAIDALDEHFDICVLLQATSPLRTGADIDGTLEVMERHDAPSAVSVTSAAKPPQWMYSLDPSGLLRPILPELAEARQRQEARPTFVLNGAVYAIHIDALRTNRRWVSPDTVAFVMPPERSIDVDSALDLVVANALVGKA